MIPTAILLGLAGGLTRWRWWSIPVIGVTWSIILSISGDPAMSLVQIWLGGLLLGALNGAAGVLASSSVVFLTKQLFRPFRKEEEVR